MKPSDRIKKVFYDNYRYILNFQYRIANARAFNALLIYLDEEAEKPKYACPNCHRIVDELIGGVECEGYTLMNGAGVPLDAQCKYCVKEKHCAPPSPPTAEETDMDIIWGEKFKKEWHERIIARYGVNESK